MLSGLISENLPTSKSEQGSVGPQFVVHVDRQISLMPSDLETSETCFTFWFIFELSERSWH